MATPTASFRVGPYLVQPDQRGVRLVREDSPTPGGSQALLRMDIAQEGRNAMPFLLQGLRRLSDVSFEFSSMATDHEALDGVLVYRPELDGFDMALTFVNATEDMVLRLGIYLELLGEADPHWLIPGLFYNDNRDRACPRLYPSYSEIRRDTKKFVSNHWMFRADRAALPVAFCTTFGVCAYLSTQETPGASSSMPLGYGVAGLGFSSEDGHPMLQASLPYIEEPVKYSYCRADRTAPVETFLRLETNTPMKAHYKVGLTPVADGGFACAWAPIYRAIYEDTWPAHALRPRLGSLEAQRLAVTSIMRWHHDEKRSMIHETSAFDKHFGRRGTNVERFQMHTGWMSGALPAFVLLWTGRERKDPDLVRAGAQVLDRITSQLAPCGTLWPMITEDEGFTAGYGPEPGLAHSRTIAEAVLFLLRAMRLEVQASTSHPEWFNAVSSNLEFILGAQRDDGALPAYWHVESGEVHSYDGAAGLCWIAPLAAFARLTSDKRHREAARAAGEYYGEMVEKDFLGGSVEDLPLVPTSDDAHFALVSYMLLYEMEREERWLELARRAADLALTFRHAYNARFHPLTMLGQAGFSTRGGDVSSVATPTLGPTGLFSYGELLKLAALTGDDYYVRRAREGRTFATQCLARIDGEYNAREGHAIGQVFHTDWWQPKGMVLTMGHAWCAAMVAYVELLERHLNIPVQAGAQGIQAMVEATHSSVVMLADEVILPDPAEVRRRRQATQDSQSAEEDSAEGPMDASALVSQFTSRLADVLGLGDEAPPPPPPRASQARRDSTASIRLPRPASPRPRPGAPAAAPALNAEAKTPPPPGEPQRPRSPLSSRHTPLPAEGSEPGGSSFTDEPTRDVPASAIARASTPSSMGSTDPTPPGGLLANLFDDSYSPPGDGGRVTDADRPGQPPSGAPFDLGNLFEGIADDDEEPTLKPKPPADEEQPAEGGGEIRWKIF